MIEFCAIVVFAIVAAFAEAKIVEREPPAIVEMATVSDEDFEMAVEVEKQWRPK